MPVFCLAHVADGEGGPCQSMTIWPVKKRFLTWIPVRGAGIDVSIGRCLGCDRPEGPGSESRNCHGPPPADGELEGC